MSNSPAWMQWLAIVSPFITIIAVPVIAHRTAKVTLTGTKHTNDEKRHETDTGAIVNFNHQLLKERTDLLNRLGRIDNQVSNGHKTNLRDDLTEVKDNSSRMLEVVEDGMRKLMDETIPLIHRNIAGLTDDVRVIRKDLSSLEDKVEGKT